MPNVKHTGTISEADAEAQQERIKEIMAETELPFGPAVDLYIEEQQAKPREATKRDWIHV